MNAQSVVNFINQAVSTAWKTSKIGSVGALGAGGAAGLAAGTYMAGSTMTGYGAFKNPGVMAAMGFEPTRGIPGGFRMSGYGAELDFTGGAFPSFEAQGLRDAFARHPKMNWEAAKDIYKTLRPGAAGAMALGGAAFSAYSGYQANGLSGAYDNIILDAAVNSSLVRWGYGIGTAAKGGKLLPAYTKLAGSPLHLTSGSLVRGVGATIGGLIGQQAGLATGIPMMGTFGATAGAYIGGAPLAAMGASPIIVGGTLMAAGAGMIAYGAYSTIKAVGQAGYNRRQSLRGVNTDGDMSSFMTQNAVTMRERAVQAIQKSHWNARQALGNEASFMTSPKNYNSRYR